MNTSTRSSPFKVSGRDDLEFDEDECLSSFLPLTDYERDLSRRLALSPKTESSVKRMARLLLELNRLPTEQQAAERTGMPSQWLLLIRQRYLLNGLQEVLSMRQQLHMPATKLMKLTESERNFCNGVLESGEGSRGRQRRARALLLMSEGKTKDCVTREAGTCARSLERLIERYQSHGAHGAVNEAERPGRPICYPKSEFIPLIRNVIHQQQVSTRFRWTAGDLRQALAKHRPEAARMSRPTLLALVAEAGFGSAPLKRVSLPLSA